MTYDRDVIIQAIKVFTGLDFESEIGSGVFTHPDYEIEESSFYRFDLFRSVYDRDTGAHNNFLLRKDLSLAELVDLLNSEVRSV